MNSHKDEVLVKRIKLHEQKALELLFEKYFYSLCDFAFTFVKSTELAEEVVSDVFLNIWLNREKLEIKTNYKSYLFVATKNQSINYLNKNKIPHEDVDILDSFEHAIANPADENIQYMELEKEINNILEELPPQRRLIFKLNRMEGLKYKEIAEALSISVNTVQNQMVEAVKHIAKYKPQLKTIFVSILIFSLFYH